MLNKELNNSNGSAMIMVIAVMVILSTVGLAVLALSITNYKISKEDKKTQMEFYMAESGLDQAYEVTVDTLKAASNFANEAITNKINEFILAERAKVLSGGTSNYIISDGTGSVNEEYLKKVLSNTEDTGKYEDWFKLYKDKYKEYLNNNLVTEIGNQNNYHVVDDSVSSEKPVIELNSPPPSLFNSSDDPCNLKVQSKSSNTNSEKVEMNFEIKLPSELPEIALVISNEETIDETIIGGAEEIKIDDNPLWDCAVATSKSIICQGYTRLTINGNAYAYLNFYMMHINNLVTVNGDISGYRTQHANEPGKPSKRSNLTVTGNIYCDNLAIHEKCSEDNIIINGSVYATGNLILNGAKSHIEIKDTWYRTNPVTYGELLTNKSPDYGDPGGSSVTYANEVGTTDNDYVRYNLMRKLQFGFPDFTNDNGTLMGNYIDFGKVTYPVDTPTYIKEQTSSEILCINKAFGGTVHIIGPYHCPITIGPNDIVFEVTGPVKGMIVTKGNVMISGSVDFTGLIVSTEGNIYSHHDYVMSSHGVDAIKTLTSSRNYIQGKVAELELAGRNPFEYTVPEGEGTINLYPWPAKKEIIVSQSSSETTSETSSVSSRVNLVQSASLTPYKELILISDWQKL